MAPPPKRRKAQKVNSDKRWPESTCSLCNEKERANDRLKEELSSVFTLVTALTSAIDQKFGPTKPMGEDLPGLLSSALVTVRKYAKKVKRAEKAQVEKQERVLGQKRAAEDELKSAHKRAKRTQVQSARQRARQIAERFEAVGKWKDKYASMKTAVGRQLEARKVVHAEAFHRAAKKEAELQQAQALRVAAKQRAGKMAAEAAATAKATSDACKREQTARRLQQAAEKEAMSAIGEIGALFAEAEEEKEKRKEAESELEKSVKRLEEERAKKRAAQRGKSYYKRRWNGRSRELDSLRKSFRERTDLLEQEKEALEEQMEKFMEREVDTIEDGMFTVSLCCL
jgi:hypothetical protein